MIGGRMSPGVLGTCAALLALVQAGPLLRFPRESEDYPNSDFSNYTANEVCFSDQKVFQRGEEVPNAGPCEECRCEPPSIVCQMLKCPVNNNGCRTIQRPNHCCPDYNCECDYNGQLYNDGERIDLPEDPCQVCYCKGGDVMCTSITCYQRDDCEPKHVPGQCCPKYEDCPIRDMEASNTEDKNVQTRSPNKTINSNPKKEMQPWLLTKSVPQTSSSLAIPKSGETTTDSGNVIIVSDWLAERKTTENFNAKLTENPNLSTYPEFITTAQPQKSSLNIEKETTFEQLQTVKPTSVDEVVFTRIELPKIIQEENNDSPTTTITTEFEKSTSFVNLPGILHDVKILSENTTSNVPSNSSLKYSEEKSKASNKTHNENSNSSIQYKELENKILTTISSTDNSGENLRRKNSTMTTNEPIKVETTKDTDAIETLTTEHFEVGRTEHPLNLNENKRSQQLNETTQNKTVKTDSETETAKDFEETTNISQGVTVSGDGVRSPEEITLERLLGIDESDEDATTKQISTSTERYNTEHNITLLDEHTNTIYTTLPAKIDQLFTIEDYKLGSLKTKPKTDIDKLEEIDYVANISLTKGENSSDFNEILQTTETSYGDEETTTLLNSDLNLNKSPLQSGNFVFESNDKFEETTYLPETTVEIETSTLFFVAVPKHLNDEVNGNVQENLIEEKQEEAPNYSTNIDSTTSSNTEISGYTDSVTSESSKRSTVQEFPVNTKSILNEGDKKNYKIQETNAFTDSTSTPDYKEGITNTLPEIEVVLGETNNKKVLDKSTSSQESNNQEEIILDLAFDEIPSENKEVIHANHPPVLELNSHVPFLQIGGDGSSESSETEYDHTTVINKLDAVNSFNKKETHRNKETIQHKPDENESNSSFTVTPSTTVEALSSTKKSSIGKVEEFTIPTLAVVPLTPGDLKMIAEYLISEKIKPVSSRNNSIYSPNSWLKGNLTSEDNIASILSAANVSIGLMNETSIGRKLETINKTTQSERFEKFEKESRYKGNSILEKKNDVTSKTEHLHEKSSDNQETLTTTNHPKEEINNSRTKNQNVSTETTNGGITTIPLEKINNTSEQDLENLQILEPEESPVEIINNVGVKTYNSTTSLKSRKDFPNTATTGSKNSDNKVKSMWTPSFDDKSQTQKADNINKDLENVHKKDNLETKEELIISGNTQISRLPISDEIPYDSSTTNDFNRKEINNKTTKSFNGNKQNLPTTVDKVNKNLENVNLQNTDKLETREKKNNHEPIQIISKMADSNEKPLGPSTNKIDTTTSKIFINKPLSEGMSS